MKAVLLFISLGFLVPAAYCDDSISIKNNGKHVVMHEEDHDDAEEAPARVEGSEDGTGNIQQGKERITKDSRGNTVITDGKDSIVFDGGLKDSQVAQRPSDNTINIDDDTQDKHVKFTSQGIQIDKGGKHIHLGN